MYKHYPLSLMRREKHGFHTTIFLISKAEISNSLKVV
jgi:hypothetical protein